MWLIDQIAEARIREAMAQGAFDGLPGAGRPLVLDDDRHVPEHLRVAYRILRNAGFLPPEAALRREIRTVEERAALSRRLQCLLIRLDETRAARLRRGPYAARLAARFAAP
ncbi:DnaJ family domain-containing protein [Inmirania thermothiophila]|uniref:Uncharacterized protein DUF1992 n=1 Tax=Inmirania thermothiophila TaxID=1750597 RepID=A0A3N1Y7F1_9GAMM|nr:DnaJ family domain-containing protein [Inmirania thermothiophila]ROR34438.1 uncharacterized protein DUF1992 [Inmirania thermothiophila]